MARCRIAYGMESGPIRAIAFLLILCPCHNRNKRKNHGDISLYFSDYR